MKSLLSTLSTLWNGQSTFDEYVYIQRDAQYALSLWQQLTTDAELSQSLSPMALIVLAYFADQNAIKQQFDRQRIFDYLLVVLAGTQHDFTADEKHYFQSILDLSLLRGQNLTIKSIVGAEIPKERLRYELILRSLKYFTQQLQISANALALVQQCSHLLARTLDSRGFTALAAMNYCIYQHIFTHQHYAHRVLRYAIEDLWQLYQHYPGCLALASRLRDHWQGNDKILQHLPSVSWRTLWEYFSAIKIKHKQANGFRTGQHENSEPSCLDGTSHHLDSVSSTSNGISEQGSTHKVATQTRVLYQKQLAAILYALYAPTVNIFSNDAFYGFFNPQDHQLDAQLCWDNFLWVYRHPGPWAKLVDKNVIAAWLSLTLNSPDKSLMVFNFCARYFYSTLKESNLFTSVLGFPDAVIQNNAKLALKQLFSHKQIEISVWTTMLNLHGELLMPIYSDNLEALDYHLQCMPKGSVVPFWAKQLAHLPRGGYLIFMKAVINTETFNALAESSVLQSALAKLSLNLFQKLQKDIDYYLTAGADPTIRVSPIIDECMRVVMAYLPCFQHLKFDDYLLNCWAHYLRLSSTKPAWDEMLCHSPHMLVQLFKSSRFRVLIPGYFPKVNAYLHDLSQQLPNGAATHTRVSLPFLSTSKSANDDPVQGIKRLLATLKVSESAQRPIFQQVRVRTIQY